MPEANAAEDDLSSDPPGFVGGEKAAMSPMSSGMPVRGSGVSALIAHAT
jgi:hypothetical protein